jgi:hypothetical protein
MASYDSLGQYLVAHSFSSRCEFTSKEGREVGSMIELNDTLQLTAEQGFPLELDLASYLKNPAVFSFFLGKEFEFTGKPGIRNFHQPPVRVFLVENRGGAWIYWGLAVVLRVIHDYSASVTSGQFKLTYLYTPAEMRQAFQLIDRRPNRNYFEHEEPR